MKNSNYKMEKEVFISKEVVLLHPFTNQVGGHNCLLKYDESNICKIIDENELSFYQNIPKELIGFVPQFNGYLEITFKKAGKNIICLSKNFDNLHDLNLNSVVSDLINTCSSCESKKSNNCECASNNRLLSLSQKVVASGRHQLMIIEDVTRKYKYPCVIDLKMGTRGCDKREKRMKKIRDISTAPNLGVKLGGFQVNHPITGRNLRMDKFEGHMLTEHEFKLVLKDFLYTGMRYRTDILPSLIKKLNKLLKSLEMIDGYRFYCCSLLLIYDGESDNQMYISVDDCVELRMIDFAHTCYKHEFDGPDLGLLFGVKSLIKIFEEIQFQLH
ncbi:inositol hexakisphosphate kinase 2 isoform X3 [Hydra vulgaris]|uniref:Kinase n=1 Tax=Hydra vulgaris TaxID=6087 RepID=A0ABM4BGH8_HYDVU